MSEKGNSKIGILVAVLVLAIIVMGVYIYKLKEEQSTENVNTSKNQTTTNTTENKADSSNNVQEKNNTNVSEATNTNAKEAKSNTTEKTTDSKSQSNNESVSVSYIILEVEDKEASEISYKEKKITDKQKIDEFMKIVDSAVPYTSAGADIGDASFATIYFTNGDKYKIAAHDKVGNEDSNMMYKWYRDDASDKTSYKLSAKLNEFIQNLFNE